MQIKIYENFKRGTEKSKKMHIESLKMKANEQFEKNNEPSLNKKLLWEEVRKLNGEKIVVQ